MNYTGVSNRVAVEDLVLAQSTSSVANRTLTDVGDAAGGLVLTDRPGVRKLQELRQLGFSKPLVLDLIGTDWRGVDAGRRTRAEAWRQASASCEADLFLTPSRRVAAGDESALVEQLEEATSLLSRQQTGDSRPAWIGLGLDGGWLNEDLAPVLERLLGTGLPTPVAIAFADTHDPIRSKGRVRTLRHLVKNVDMAIVRTDLAGLGAWAYGARFASIGLSSTVRHLPIPLPTAAAHTDRTPHVLLPRVLAWVKASALWFAGDHPAFRCSCLTCGYRWLGRLGDESPGREQEALLHSFHTWFSIAHHLQGARTDERQVAWHRLCKDALDAEEELADELGISLDFRWQPLRAWSWL